MVRKKVVYLEELRRRGPDFGGYPWVPPVQPPGLPNLETLSSSAWLQGLTPHMLSGALSVPQRRLAWPGLLVHLLRPSQCLLAAA